MVHIFVQYLCSDTPILHEFVDLVLPLSLMTSSLTTSSVSSSSLSSQPPPAFPGICFGGDASTLYKQIGCYLIFSVLGFILLKFYWCIMLDIWFKICNYGETFLSTLLCFMNKTSLTGVGFQTVE